MSNQEGGEATPPKSPSPSLVKVAAVVLAIISLRAAIGGVRMAWRFGALWDAAFFLGVASCLLLLALGMFRGRIQTLALSVAALFTIAARLMSDAVPILKYGFTDPVRWLPLTLGCTVGLTAFLLAMTPSVRRWFAEAAAE